jgi:hypothetical protein
MQLQASKSGMKEPSTRLQIGGVVGLALLCFWDLLSWFSLTVLLTAQQTKLKLPAGPLSQDWCCMQPRMESPLEFLQQQLQSTVPLHQQPVWRQRFCWPSCCTKSPLLWGSAQSSCFPQLTAAAVTLQQESVQVL